MDKDKLVNRLVKFCLEYGVLDASADYDYIRNTIDSNLGEPYFVEMLIKIVINKTKATNGIDIEQVITLLSGLELIRFEQEHKDCLPYLAG